MNSGIARLSRAVMRRSSSSATALQSRCPVSLLSTSRSTPFARPSPCPSRSFSLSTLHSMSELRDTVESATNQGRLTVIEWKATWCGKCKVLAKEMERLALAHPEVEFRFADIEEGDLKEGKKEAGIDHLPVLHFIKGGELVHAITGVRINEMAKTVAQYAGLEGSSGSAAGGAAGQQFTSTTPSSTANSPTSASSPAAVAGS